MGIAGIGTQVLECARVRKLLQRHGEVFLHQVFTDREVRFCNRRTHATEHLTAFWAAKEAVFRALGTSWRRGMIWADVEVVKELGAGPMVVIRGKTVEVMAAKKVADIMLTTAQCRAFATATAIAVRA